MSTSGRHHDIPTDTTTPTGTAAGADETVATPVVTTDDPVDDAPADEPADDTGRPVQLTLATPDAHVRFHLDRRTREIGLAHVAEIKRQLAANAARRAEQQAAASRTPQRRSASDRAA